MLGKTLYGHPWTMGHDPSLHSFIRKGADRRKHLEGKLYECGGKKDPHGYRIDHVGKNQYYPSIGWLIIQVLQT